MRSNSAEDSIHVVFCPLACFGNIEMMRMRRAFVGLVCILAVVLVVSLLNGHRMDSSKVLVSSTKDGRNSKDLLLDHYFLAHSVPHVIHNGTYNQNFNLAAMSSSDENVDSWPSKLVNPGLMEQDFSRDIPNADSAADAVQPAIVGTIKQDLGHDIPNTINGKPPAGAVQPAIVGTMKQNLGHEIPNTINGKPPAGAVQPATVATVAACTPRKNIVFFKMHKCSSSTVQNILFRYGENHNLTFVIPAAGNYLGHATFTKRAMVQLPTKEYNILCHHTRFNEPAMTEVMPSNSVYVSILRESVSMYESMFTYSKYGDMYQISSPNKLNTFLQNPRRYYERYGGKDHAKSPMMYDFGLENALKDNQKYIDEMIERLDKRFDLVMMTEYFHESLILFKELMCWSIDDIVYFTLNARSKSSVVTVNSDMQKKIRKWNEGDVKLYNHFNKTFWRKVQEFGEERMKEEIKQLSQRNDELYKRCVATVSNNDGKVWHPPGIKVESFQVKDSAKNDKQCVAMSRTELPYTDLLRRKMKQKYHIR